MELKHIFGPVPSRRLGRSLGVSPIPDSTCNYSCVYCQLGRTRHMTNHRQLFFPVEEILDEFRSLPDHNAYDVVTVVGEGEPTLYAGLGELIHQLKQYTEKPIAVITNGALLSDAQVRQELMEADIVLPSLDAADAATFKRVDRPHGGVSFDAMTQGLIEFSHQYQGQLWLEVMLLDGVNDSDESLAAIKALMDQMRYDRVYVNTPVRPPAESDALPSKAVEKASALFSGISIDMLTQGSFFSETPDDLEAVVGICRRHPMNQFEIASFLHSRGRKNTEDFFKKLEQDSRITAIDFKGVVTYRAKQVN